MECIFLNSAGVTLFTRNDMEQGHWVCQEMNMTADFPFDPNKVIEHGQRIAFRDPATDTLQVFEIRVVVNSQPDHYQQITAEHICLAELQDEHIDKTEITNKTAKKALQTALTGTLWSAGTSYDSSTQSADFSRGSVWDAISTIQDNWNVHIVPRVTISAAGVITGRYLDIYPVQVYVEAGGPIGPGVRLSVRKNFLDPAVTYDDEEVITAMYGYGGSVLVPQQDADDKSEELTFKDEVWTASDGHPAKPSGQTYLEWPEKTALYGRGAAGSKRQRFGYYQNANIKDAAVLLQKTWESLQLSSDPKISISGTVIDLYRLGYKDQPLKLHDMVIVEIEETGELFVKQITCLDVDLVDPTGTRVDIGDYIPNIVYINRDTNKKASGGGGGGGGRGSMTDLEDEQTKYVTWFDRTDRTIGMYMGIKNGDVYLNCARICLEINDADKTVAYIQADHVVIGNGQTIDPNYRGKDLDGTMTQITTDFTVVNTLLAKKIEADDINATTVQAAISDIAVLSVNTLSVSNSIGCTGTISGSEIWAGGSKLNLIDASVSNDGKTLTITRGSGGAINFTSGGAYNDGWNDCIDAATGVSCLTGYSNYNNATSSTLYYYDTSTLSYQVATGSAKVWRYGGSTSTKYTLPDPKT